MESTIRQEVEQITRIYETIKLTNEISVERETMVSKITDSEKVTTKSYLVGGNTPEGSDILLADKNVRELHRQHNIFYTKDEEIKKEVYKYEVDPYSIIEELGNSWSEYLELLRYDWSKYILSELEGKELLGGRNENSIQM